jgi:thiamine-phosphate pyrophosphorylase
MFIIKNNYYLYIENLEVIKIESLKINKKLNIIYRKLSYKNIYDIIKFRKKCQQKNIKFFIANNLNVAKKINADGLYISAHNKKKYYSNILKIGSAHNIKEINEKANQGCKNIIFSRLFKTSKKNKKNFLGVIKFNLLKTSTAKNIYPLGGINNKNLLKLNMVNSLGFALMSEIKKKPAITNRLF